MLPSGSLARVNVARTGERSSGPAEVFFRFLHRLERPHKPLGLGIEDAHQGKHVFGELVDGVEADFEPAAADGDRLGQEARLTGGRSVGTKLRSLRREGAAFAKRRPSM